MMYALFQMYVQYCNAHGLAADTYAEFVAELAKEIHDAYESK